MKKKIMTVAICIIMIAGFIMASVFIFAMPYWNAEVPREACAQVETQFAGYGELPGRSKVAYIECSNGELYHIDGASADSALGKLSMLTRYEDVTLLLHPKTGAVIELSNSSGPLLAFDESIKYLKHESIVSISMGLFLYAILVFLIIMGIRGLRNEKA